MRINLPDLGDRYDAIKLGRLIEVLRRAFSSAISSDEAAPRLLLRSPDGKTWRVTVDDLGALQVAQESKTLP